MELVLDLLARSAIDLPERIAAAMVDALAGQSSTSSSSTAPAGGNALTGDVHETLLQVASGIQTLVKQGVSGRLQAL